MPRNKNPEETINKILDVSIRLFMEKGYEATCVQDIIDNLGGLTKGAIYHHFKSKEDIMLAVIDRAFEGHDAEWERILEDSSMTGLEKFREMLRASINSSRQRDLFFSAPQMLRNPKMLVLQMKSIVEESAPRYVKPIIEQGVADGSIQTDYPGEMAEVILLLINLWVTPMVFPAPPEEMQRRVAFFQELLQGLGIELLDEQMLERMEELNNYYSNKNAPDADDVQPA